jgi:glycogen(starch) synthase
VKVAGAIELTGQVGHLALGRREQKAIQLLGQLTSSEMAAMLGRATIYALPARYEPFGLSVLEAALSGCALVLGDIASMRELWSGAASFVDPDDSEGLKAELRSLIRDPKRCAWAGRAAVRRAREYDAERMANAYAELYCKLLHGNAVEVPCG